MKAKPIAMLFAALAVVVLAWLLSGPDEEEASPAPASDPIVEPEAAPQTVTDAEPEAMPIVQQEPLPVPDADPGPSDAGVDTMVAAVVQSALAIAQQTQKADAGPDAQLAPAPQDQQEPATAQEESAQQRETRMRALKAALRLIDAADKRLLEELAAARQAGDKDRVRTLEIRRDRIHARGEALRQQLKEAP